MQKRNIVLIGMPVPVKLQLGNHCKNSQHGFIDTDRIIMEKEKRRLETS